MPTIFGAEQNPSQARGFGPANVQIPSGRSTQRFSGIVDSISGILDDLIAAKADKALGTDLASAQAALARTSNPSERRVRRLQIEQMLLTKHGATAQPKIRAVLSGVGPLSTQLITHADGTEEERSFNDVGGLVGSRVVNKGVETLNKTLSDLGIIEENLPNLTQTGSKFLGNMNVPGQERPSQLSATDLTDTVGKIANSVDVVGKVVSDMEVFQNDPEVNINTYNQKVEKSKLQIQNAYTEGLLSLANLSVHKELRNPKNNLTADQVVASMFAYITDMNHVIRRSRMDQVLGMDLLKFSDAMRQMVGTTLAQSLESSFDGTKKVSDRTLKLQTNLNLMTVELAKTDMYRQSPEIVRLMVGKDAVEALDKLASASIALSVKGPLSGHAQQFSRMAQDLLSGHDPIARIAVINRTLDESRLTVGQDPKQGWAEVQRIAPVFKQLLTDDFSGLGYRSALNWMKENETTAKELFKDLNAAERTQFAEFLRRLNAYLNNIDAIYMARGAKTREEVANMIDQEGNTIEEIVQKRKSLSDVFLGK